ncbi:DUF4097 family beta strand repeat-containing protein [Bacillus sp. DX1.1]|uniref:DUF4097 family beta strand repeat-containing protein n=1 Tax=unclassified Bacillus (in: firmicutes) TaxID=185979 RepID=UPI002570EB97|nr:MULTISPECIES: DUF4097 family beta strand repeat-containing protein [unclassified Bacillus (in: firmicutes)]MDM5153139.1 DUF4097 family beta strand repeat-containing protein [Bacillus sp. DX1.1]WJE82108.1 DUF4097 family beta strand repeat-containing protein [Bacillus sp. DX3.1]
MKKVVFIALFLLIIGIIGAGAITVLGGAFNDTEIHKKETVASEKIDDIQVEAPAADVEIVPTDLKEIEVSLDGSVSKNVEDKYKFTVKETNNKLNVEFVTDDSLFGLQLGTVTDVKLQIKIPKKMYENIQATTSSGDAVARGLETKELTMKTSSGDLSLIDSKINNKLTATTSSGDAVTRGIEARELTMKASSGDLSLLDSKIDDKLTAKTSSGAIESKKNDIEMADFNTSSGKIQVDGLRSKNVVFKTSSGNIEYNDSNLKGDVECSTSSGDISMRFETLPDSLKVDFDGSSGKADVNVDGLSYEEKSKNTLIGVKGSGENNIKVRTSSGDFKLR